MRELTRTERDSSWGWFHAYSALLPDGLLLINPEHGLEFSNPAARRLLGGEGEADFDRRVHRVVGELQADLCHPATLKPRGRRRKLDLPAGEFPVPRLHVQIHAVDQEECKGHLLVLKDREAQEAVDRNYRMMSRMNALSEHYRSAVHELKTPLNAVVLNVELVRQQIEAAMPEGEPRRRAVRSTDLIQKEVSRLNRLLVKTLSLSRPESDKHRPFSLQRLIKEVASLTRPQAALAGVEVETDLQRTAVRLHGVRDQWKQVMLNLFHNAIEAMPQGGTLSVRMRAENGKARLKILDTGEGVPPELLDRVFSAHVSSKPDGSGIGLFVARSVVERHGGSIDLESRRGRGTTVSIQVPTYAPES